MTEDTPSKPATSRPERKIRWGCIASIFALPIGIIMLTTIALRVTWTIRESLGQSAMEKRLAEMEAEGIPIDNFSVDAEYLAKTSATNSERWITLLDKLESPEFKKQTVGVFDFDPALDEATFVAEGDWPYDASAQAFLAANSRELEEIVELSSYRESVTFPIVYESWNTLLPYTQGMRTASRLMWLDGLMAIRSNDSKRVERAIQALLGNAEVCADEPFFISRLVCISQVFMAVDLAKLAIENQRLELEELNLLLPLFLDASKVDDTWQTAIRGERAIGIPNFMNPDLARNGDSMKQLPPRGRDCIIFLDLMAQAEQIKTPDIDSLRSAGKKMTAELDKVIRNGSWLTKMDSLLTGVMAPAFEAYADAIVRKLMRCRLAAIATKIEIFRRSNGRLPTNLKELGLPLDQLMPPGGKPFGYRLDLEGNAVLWGFSLTKGDPGQVAATSTPDDPPPTEGLPQIVEESASVTWKIKK